MPLFSRFKGTKEQRDDLNPSASTDPTYSSSTFANHSSNSKENYAPPSGPPPSFLHRDKGHQYNNEQPQYQPPAYTDTTDQQPQHDWQSAVPDTSTLPPPPSIAHEASDTTNATYDSAERAHEWCERHPVQPSRVLEGEERERYEDVRARGAWDLQVSEGNRSRFQGVIQRVDEGYGSGGDGR